MEVRDRKNHKNQDFIDVIITKIDYLGFAENIKVIYNSFDEIIEINLLLKETFINTLETIDILAFSRINEENFVFSNCSALEFSVKSNENESNLLEIKYSSIGYSNLLNIINNDIEKNVFYKENLKRNIQNFANFSNYLSYIIDDDITEEELMKTFSFYKNYGVCSRYSIKSKEYTGETLLRVKTYYFQFFKNNFILGFS